MCSRGGRRGRCIPYPSHRHSLRCRALWQGGRQEVSDGGKSKCRGCKVGLRCMGHMDLVWAGLYVMMYSSPEEYVLLSLDREDTVGGMDMAEPDSQQSRFGQQLPGKLFSSACVCDGQAGANFQQHVFVCGGQNYNGSAGVAFTSRQSGASTQVCAMGLRRRPAS